MDTEWRLIKRKRMLSPHSPPRKTSFCSRRLAPLKAAIPPRQVSPTVNAALPVEAFTRSSQLLEHPTPTSSATSELQINMSNELEQGRTSPSPSDASEPELIGLADNEQLHQHKMHAILQANEQLSPPLINNAVNDQEDSEVECIGTQESPVYTCSGCGLEWDGNSQCPCNECESEEE